MKTLMLILALVGVTAAGGCVVEGPHGEVAVIATGHVHSDYCGHYYYGGHWYYSPHHHHGPGCGHVYRGGVWIWAS